VGENTLFEDLRGLCFYEGTSRASCEDEVERIVLGSCSLQGFDVGSTEPPGSAARARVKVSVVKV
jgi:hypothetical protein